MKDSNRFDDILDRYKQDMMKTYHNSKSKISDVPLSRHFDVQETYIPPQKNPPNSKADNDAKVFAEELNQGKYKTNDTATSDTYIKDNNLVSNTISEKGYNSKSNTYYDNSDLYYNNHQDNSKQNAMFSQQNQSKEEYCKKYPQNSFYSDANNAWVQRNNIVEKTVEFNDNFYNSNHNTNSYGAYHNNVNSENPSFSSDEIIKNSKAYFDILEMQNQTTELPLIESVPEEKNFSQRPYDTPYYNYNKYNKKTEPDYDKDIFGYLQVSVTAANAAVPIPNAHIIIFTEENGKLNLYKMLTTDWSGNTVATPLAAPDAEYSLSPSNGIEKPYSEYNVFVSADGFRPVENINVPIFANVKSILPINMIPLLEYENNRGTVIENIGKEPNL